MAEKPQPAAAGPAPKPAPAPSAGGSSDSRLWAAIGYPIWIIPLIVMFTDKKNDKWLLFHAYQALIFGVAVWIVSVVTSFLLIGCVIGLIGFLAMLFYGYKAYQGEKFKIPVVGDMAENYAK